MAVSLEAPFADEAADSLAEYFTGVEGDWLHWDTASEVAERCVSILDSMPDDSVLNVNVPNCPVGALAGLRQARLAPFGNVHMAVAEAGEGYVRTTVERATDRLMPDTDTALLSHGYATLTVITTIREVPSVLDLNGLTGGPSEGGGGDRRADPAAQVVA
jgi:5'-nucleotidase